MSVLNFLEAMEMPIGTEFIEKSTRDYYKVNDCNGLEDAQGYDITLSYQSFELANFRFELY